MPVILKIRWRSSLPTRDGGLFGDVFIEQGQGWAARAGSLAMHALLLVLVPQGLHLASLLTPVEPAAPTYSVEPLRLNLSDRLYYSAGKDATAEGAARQTRAVELPPLPRHARGDTTVLQPHAVRAEAAPPKIPPVAFWSSGPARAAKSLVTPGRKEALREPPQLDAPPQLEIPKREPQLGVINVASLITTKAPALPQPPSSTVPVRVWEGSRGGPLETVLGEAAHLIAFGSEAVPPAGLLTVPRAVAARGQGSSGWGAESGASGRGPRNASAGDLGTTAARVSGSAARAEFPDPFSLTRITRPAGGRFKVVVTGSSPSEAYPEAGRFLAGRIVYTVYVHVGTRKDWILQYSLAGQKPNGIAAALESPYPFVILRPAFTSAWATDYLVVHGVVNSSGRFEGLAVVSEVEPATRALLLAALEQWELRPATRAGVPTPVEMLLIIPREPA